MNRRGFLQLLCGTALASVMPAMQAPASFEWSGFYTAFPMGNFYANPEWAPVEFTGFEVTC
jgi:hypothetical protein